MSTPARFAACAIALAIALVVRGDPPTALMAGDAALRLDGDDMRLAYVIFTGKSYGSVLETLNEKAERPGGDGSLSYTFVRSGKLRGTGRCVTQRTPEGGLRVRHDVTAHVEFSGVGHGFVLKVPAGAFAKQAFAADGKAGVFPEKPSGRTVASGEAKSFSVTCPNKRKWTVTFAKPIPYLVQDTRPDERGDFAVCFFCGGSFKLGVGKGLDASCTLTSDGGAVQGGVRGFSGISEGKEWVRLDWIDEIKPSSALDFSRGAHRRLPAGADGRLLATTNGAFAFSRRPGVEQRFFGVAIGGDAAFPQKQAAQTLAKDLARRGYNSVRLYSLEGNLLAKEPKKGFFCDPEAAARIDQLVFSCEREGLYIAYDIVGRRAYTWADLRVPPQSEDDPSSETSLGLFLVNDGADKAWQGLAKILYCRKNKAMNRVYAEDPGVPLVLSTNEGGLFRPWNDLRTMPFVREAYSAWLKDARKKDPSFLEGRVCEPADLGVMPLDEKKAFSVRRFLAETETNGVARQRAFLAAQKSKALVGALHAGLGYGDVAQQRGSAGDFSTFTFGFDGPQQLGVKHSYPYRLDNRNSLERASPIPRSLAMHVPTNRALCVTAWNAPSPSEWRAPLGLLVGATAGRDGWDGIWRVRDGNDPMCAALERAVYALYVRGDMPRGSSKDAPKDAFVIRDGGLTVHCARTAGGFSPKANGKIAAGPLTAELSGFRAAVWVSSLDLQPVVTSKRLLLTHLTDMQSIGSLFADSRHDLLLSRGKGGVAVRHGTARIQLALEKPQSYKVYALGTGGTRGVAVPTSVTADGKLEFTADVRGSRGAQFLYEIVRR